MEKRNSDERNEIGINEIERKQRRRKTGEIGRLRERERKECERERYNEREKGKFREIRES